MEATQTSTTTPDAAGVSQAAVAAVSEPVAAPASRDRVAEAIAAYNTAKAKRETPEAAPVTEPEPVVAPTEVAAPPPAAEPADEKYARLFERVSSMEVQRKAEAGEVETLRQKAKRADELEAKWSKWKEDPEQLFSSIGWDADTISAYITGDKTKVKQQTALSETEQKIAALEKKLQERDEKEANDRARSEQERQITTLRTQLPALLSGDGAKKMPNSARYFKGHGQEYADALIMTVQGSRANGKDLSFEEAAVAVENVIKAQRQRHLSELDGSGEASAPVSKATPTSGPTLTNALTSPTHAVDPAKETADEKLQRAMATYASRTRSK